jgi:hypothetical protein
MAQRGPTAFQLIGAPDASNDRFYYFFGFQMKERIAPGRVFG